MSGKVPKICWTRLCEQETEGESKHQAGSGHAGGYVCMNSGVCVCTYAGSTCPLVCHVHSRNLTLLVCLLCLCVRGCELHNTSTCKRLVIPEPLTKAVSAKATAEGREAPRAFSKYKASAENAPDWEPGEAGDEEKGKVRRARGGLPRAGIKGKDFPKVGRILVIMANVQKASAPAGGRSVKHGMRPGGRGDTRNLLY